MSLRQNSASPYSSTSHRARKTPRTSKAVRSPLPPCKLVVPRQLTQTSYHHPQRPIPARLPRRSPPPGPNATAQRAQARLPRHPRRQAAPAGRADRHHRREPRHGHGLHARHRPQRRGRNAHLGAAEREASARGRRGGQARGGGEPQVPGPGGDEGELFGVEGQVSGGDGGAQEGGGGGEGARGEAEEGQEGGAQVDGEGAVAAGAGGQGG